MSSTSTISPATRATIDQCQTYLTSVKGRLLTTFAAVPDDKLNWKPSPTAKSAIQLAAHAANSNFSLSRMIRRDPAPVGSMEELHEAMAKAEAAITTREQLIETLEKSTAEVIAALSTLDDESIVAIVPSPFFTAPMSFWMNLPARHIDNHAAQIDYLQTIWGDQEWHMG